MNDGDGEGPGITKGKRSSARKRFPTRNELPAAVQESDLLNALVADAIDLMLQAKQAHWNVKGMHFLPLHELFDRVAKTAEEAADLLAERVVQLGGVAEGTVHIASSRSRLHEYPHSVADGREHVDSLVGTIAAFGTNVRNAIAEAAKLQDAVTADILTDVARAAEKQLWLVEAHLHA